MSGQSVTRPTITAALASVLALAAMCGVAHASAAPAIEREWVSGVTTDDATLHAEINPHGLETEYRFHLYWHVICPPPPGGAQCQIAGGWIGHPLPPGNIDAADGVVEVSLTLSDAAEELHPETEYRYSVDASNEMGPASGATQTFTTPSQFPPPSPPVNIAAPSLSGTPELGETLTCTSGSWENAPSEYSYAWLRDASVIPAQDGNTYQVQADDQGHDLACEETASNEAGSASATSNTVGIPTPPAPPSNIELPNLAGTPEVGGMLTCSNGTWENGPTDYIYSWLRDGSPLVSGGNKKLVVTEVDRGHLLSCTVTASNEGGSASATSNALTVPSATSLPPESTTQSMNAIVVAPVIGTPPASHKRKCRSRSAHRPIRRSLRHGGAMPREPRGCRRRGHSRKAR